MKTISENEKPAVQAASAISREARIQLGFLSGEFLLGMALRTVGQPFETTGADHTASIVLLWLHVVVGVGLIGGAVMAIRAARSGGKQPLQLAGSGGLLIFLTFITGVITVITKNDWWSFAMAAGFLASLLLYGQLLVQAQRLSPQPEQPS